ncbi:MAG: hypothetical protein Ct9H300mP18_10090 [Candidatus Neomarinimicrobiota bacterium]|nr:MAG: hypothetical protein Ct9H300mP18_10090 [Candidatus Neomarinimicrobiota bacterium]
MISPFNDLDLTAYWGNQTGSFSYRRVFAEKLMGKFFLFAKSLFFPLVLVWGVILGNLK